MRTLFTLNNGAAALSFLTLAVFAACTWLRVIAPTNVATWVMWTLLHSAILWGIVATGESYVLSASYVAGSVLVLAAHVSRAPWKWTRVETAAGIGTAVSMILRQTLSPEWAVVAGVAALWFAGVPLYVGLWHAPERKLAWLFVASAVSCLLVLIGTWPWTVGGSLLPGSGLAYNLLGLYVVLRRTHPSTPPSAGSPAGGKPSRGRIPSSASGALAILIPIGGHRSLLERSTFPLSQHHMILTTWADVVANSLANLWLGIAAFLPSLFGALVIFLVGLIVAAALGALVEKILEAVKLDRALGRAGIDTHVSRGGLRMRAAYLLGQIVRWFFIIVFTLAAADTLGLYALTAFLRDVLAYLPNVIVAALILVASLAVANILSRIVAASTSAARLAGAGALSTITWWAVMIFGILSALYQLNVAQTIITAIVTGVIAMLALAGGLAFGLGGRSYAEHLLDKLRRSTES